MREWVTVTVARRLSSSRAMGRPTSALWPTTTQCLPAKKAASAGAIVSSSRITPAGVHGCRAGVFCARGTMCEPKGRLRDSRPPTHQHEGTDVAGVEPIDVFVRGYHRLEHGRGVLQVPGQGQLRSSDAGRR